MGEKAMTLIAYVGVLVFGWDEGTTVTKCLAGSGLVLVLVGCGATADDGMNEARAWCHDRKGYIANTGWYEYKCIINNTPVYIPSPKDKP